MSTLFLNFQLSANFQFFFQMSTFFLNFRISANFQFFFQIFSLISNVFPNSSFSQNFQAFFQIFEMNSLSKFRNLIEISNCQFSISIRKSQLKSGALRVCRCSSPVYSICYHLFFPFFCIVLYLFFCFCIA